MAVESKNDAILVLNDRPELLLLQPHFAWLSSTVNGNVKLLSREDKTSLVNFVYLQVAHLYFFQSLSRPALHLTLCICCDVSGAQILHLPSETPCHDLSVLSNGTKDRCILYHWNQCGRRFVCMCNKTNVKIGTVVTIYQVYT